MLWNPYWKTPKIPGQDSYILKMSKYIKGRDTL